MRRGNANAVCFPGPCKLVCVLSALLRHYSTFVHPFRKAGVILELSGVSASRGVDGLRVPVVGRAEGISQILAIPVFFLKLLQGGSLCELFDYLVPVGSRKRYNVSHGHIRIRSVAVPKVLPMQYERIHLLFGILVRAVKQKHGNPFDTF